MELYSHLCQISHPSIHANSTVLFHQDDKMIVCGDSFNYELCMIEHIVEDMSEHILTVYRVHSINAFEILELLNLFNIQEISTNFNLSDDLKNLDSWKEIENYIQESKTLYKLGVKSGAYA